MGYTPVIRQYLEIKAQYPDDILFFRLGDFYEMFFEDAVVASKELEITLTGRDGGDSERIPMCGVPYHAADNYIARLISKGRRVAVCEQVEDPSVARGIVRREVTRVISPGTIMEGQLLEEKRNNYLAGIVQGGERYGLAVTDITTGTFMIGSFSGEQAWTDLLDEIMRLMPSETILPLSICKHKSSELKYTGVLTVICCKDEYFSEICAGETMVNHFGSDMIRENIPTGQSLAVRAAGALLSYLKETQKRTLSHINRIQLYDQGQFLFLDATSRRNLELTRAITDGSKKNTLLSVLDYTVTAMGGRLLRTLIEQPLTVRDNIEERLDAVGELRDNTLLRQDIKAQLKGVYDLERLAARVSFGTANARDLVALKKSLSHLPSIRSLLDSSRSVLLRELRNAMEPFEETAGLLNRSISDEPPLSTRDGGIIKAGFDQEVDRLRAAGHEGKTMLARMEEREKSRTGIKSLKIGYNKVFGYYIEVTKSNLQLVPGEYQRRQTLANAERFITQELKEYEDLILGSEERLVQLEYRIFMKIREELAQETYKIQKTARALAYTDALCSLAEAAVAGCYARPVFNSDGISLIKEGRHPVLEQVLGPGNFVPNDTFLDSGNRLVIITGPNMAGKSTYMRQVALIVLMAQMGSFVPASSANLSLVDRIFTRVGASDDLAGGRSTFMVEMSECRVIVREATKNSLIIMDEVGRGTSTYDGISIARALAEYIHLNIGAKTLFSTHYHELTDLEAMEGIVNFNVAVKEVDENIIFLRKVIPGKADRSYGVHVAKLAGLPDEIIRRSTEILHGFENIIKTPWQVAACREVEVKARDKKDDQSLLVLEELRNINLNAMTPMEAINKLYQLQNKLNNCIL